ncbi:hypothetical protein L6R52_25570 [Myxococcota bacterium]|nr:hypothetical protein [Myxococcota bacterium]
MAHATGLASWLRARRWTLALCSFALVQPLVLLGVLALAEARGGLAAVAGLPALLALYAIQELGLALEVWGVPHAGACAVVLSIGPLALAAATAGAALDARARRRAPSPSSTWTRWFAAADRLAAVTGLAALTAFWLTLSAPRESEREWKERTIASVVSAVEEGRIEDVRALAMPDFRGPDDVGADATVQRLAAALEHHGPVRVFWRVEHHPSPFEAGDGVRHELSLVAVPAAPNVRSMESAIVVGAPILELRVTLALVKVWRRWSVGPEWRIARVSLAPSDGDGGDPPDDES